MVTKAKYLGSLILPSPVEVEVTLSLYSDRVEIPELEATIYLDKVEKVSIVKGSELPPETMMMAGVVGLVIDKDKLCYYEHTTASFFYTIYFYYYYYY